MTVATYELRAAEFALAIYQGGDDPPEPYNRIFDAVIVNGGTVTGLAYIPEADTLYIAYRGTSSRPDVKYDAIGGRILSGMGFVRGGFYRGHRRTYRGVRNFIEDMWESVGIPGAIVICGHSLGAASGLCALMDLWRDYPSLRSTLAYCGFGAPRALSWGSARMLKLELGDKASMFLRRGDPVPSVPPMITGWRHPITVRYLGRNGMEVRDEMGIIRRFIMSVRHAILGVLSRGRKHSMADYFEDINRYPIDRERVLSSISDKSVTIYRSQSNEFP